MNKTFWYEGYEVYYETDRGKREINGIIVCDALGKLSHRISLCPPFASEGEFYYSINRYLEYGIYDVNGFTATRLRTALWLAIYDREEKLYESVVL